MNKKDMKSAEILYLQITTFNGILDIYLIVIQKQY